MPVGVARPSAGLLDDLLELFLAEGFGHFTLAQLAARLRCSKTTLYTLGHSKEQLTANALKQFFRTSAEAVERRTAAADAPADRIATYLRAVADALRPASPAFMADVAAQPLAREIYERNTAIAAERVAQLIADGVRAGDFRDVHAAFVADTVAATMQRIQTGQVLAATGLHDADAYDELAALVLDGIRSGAGRATRRAPR
ncbi:TetR/AcrR family transcriptional regulator [Conexibacter stalactiti]|uniref:TetR/AcrR family transcriptional regulator n=1 Tax=Conexibacter stalactiti TaxID=1940611 RepID=A0ABU4HR56_9ACTN|nr:TetR/AcrR family transcriptional regulator [Conexibacter stalactiti]MDW5595786.1 TetR/AcrR family transcriptional regulator [Conexibacter stalactiti]MEC5036428.1 TetR/AcrR family transcriptional regulator [Conexibacter stalactiti]